MKYYINWCILITDITYSPERMLSMKEIFTKLNEDKLAVHSACSAFFIFISIVPILMLLTLLIKYTPLTNEAVIVALKNLAPEEIGNVLISWFRTANPKDAQFIPLYIIMTLWTASKGFIGIIESLENITKPEKTFPVFVNRIRAVIYTLLLLFVILVSGVLFIYSNSLLSLFGNHLPKLPSFVITLIDSRLIITLIMFFIIFTLIYTFVPRIENNFRLIFKHIKQAIPGALFSTIGWLCFSMIYSIYIDVFVSKSIVYGSITIIVVFMLWLYFCVYIFLLGAELNQYILTHKVQK